MMIGCSKPKPVLVILGGLPGVGKSSLARALAGQIGAVHLRIDSIEQALRDSGVVLGPLEDAGYRIAYALAGDNLRIGNTVIADSVNPISLTRAAWRAVAAAVPTTAFEIEIICSDADEHRRRVETRTTDIPGLTLPTWEEVRAREFHPWDRVDLVVDTSAQTIEHGASKLRKLLSIA
jgi:predicted kinase